MYVPLPRPVLFCDLRRGSAFLQMALFYLLVCLVLVVLVGLSLLVLFLVRVCLVPGGSLGISRRRHRQRITLLSRYWRSKRHFF